MNGPSLVWSGGAAVLAALVLAAGGAAAAPAPAPFEVQVEVQNVVCAVPEYTLTNNGSGMFWGSGSSQIVRSGERLFVSAFEAVPGVAPLNNARWALYESTADGWRLCQRDEAERTREPCPLGVGAGRLVLSVNPTLVPPVMLTPGVEVKPTGGPARPAFLEFDPARPELPPQSMVPAWAEAPPFTDHSYRAFAADGVNGEFILFQQSAGTQSCWAFLDRDRQWRTGRALWPSAEDPRYSVQGARSPVNYANAILSDRRVWMIGQSPYNIWNRIDPAQTETWGRNRWGWRMRKLHCAWTPDITTTPFSEWVAIDDTMDDGGTIGMGDSWLAPDGRVHLVWQKEPIHPRLRDEYFPDIRRDWRMFYGILADGVLAEKHQVLAGGETCGPLRPTGYIGHPRLHVTPDHTLYILCNLVGGTPETRDQSGTWAVRVEPGGRFSEPVRVPLEAPLAVPFFTASPRAGCALTEAVDILSAGRRDGEPVALYTRLRFVPPTRPHVSIEGRGALLPGEGRTLRLTARVTDPQDDPTVITWHLPDGSEVAGQDLVWTAPGAATRLTLAATARDPQGHEGRATLAVSLPPPELASAEGLVRVEAEDFTGQGGGTARVCHPVGAAASISYWEKDIGHWLEWSFALPEEGRYELWMRYTTPGEPRRALLIDGQSPGPAFDNLAIPATGGWCSVKDEWAVLRLGEPLALSAGRHTLRLTNLAGGLGVDCFVLRRLP